MITSVNYAYHYSETLQNATTHNTLPFIRWSGGQIRASHCSHLSYNLETRRTCVRDTWSELPFPADILTWNNKLAADQRKKLRVQPNFAYNPVDEENNLLKHKDDNDLFVEDPADKSIDSSSDDCDEDGEGHDNIQTHKREDIAEDIIENERVRQEIGAEIKADVNLDGHTNPVDWYLRTSLYAETTPEEHVHRHRHQTRSKGPAEKLTAFKDVWTWVKVALKA